VLSCCGVLAIWVGLAQSQTDPWWNPLNPYGQSHGITYGTALPTQANSGYSPGVGQLAVQITAGSPPVLNMYDQSNLSWVEMLSASSGGLTDNFVPVWDSSLGVLEDTELQAGGIPAAGASGNFFHLDPTLNAMDGSDVVRGFFVEFTNANHSGASNNLYAFHAFTITGDAQAIEYAFAAGDGWDAGIALAGANTSEILFTDATAHVRYADLLSFSDDIKSSNLFTLMMYDFPDANADFADTLMIGMGNGQTIAAMDGSDVYSLVEADITNADHTGASNELYFFDANGITGDADAYESAVRLGGGFDTHITFVETGASPPDNPPTGQVAMFVDDNADYSGAGGNDCILGMIDSTGNITVVATLVLNGACP
jgi:hypothetical protein